MERRRQGNNRERQRRQPHINIPLEYQNGLYQTQIPPEPDVNYQTDSPYNIPFTPGPIELAEAKDRLGKVAGETAGKSSDWLRLRSTTDIYKGLRRVFAERFDEKRATNAFLKYFELMSVYYPVSGLRGKLTAFMNAELPGSALTAVAHYMCQSDVPFDWVASSLMPDESDTRTLGDEFGYFKHNRDKWLMSATNNGDMTIVDNIIDFEKRIGPKSARGGVDLYSHDAGIDVSGRDGSEQHYNDQETANAKVHFGCAIAGLVTLRNGGMFIAKQYTFYETFTWNAIILYAGCFEKFYLSKPVTSRPTNSEIYLVGIGFRGISDELRSYLLGRLANWSMEPLIPEKSVRITSAVGALQQFCKVIYSQQISMMDETVSLYKRYNIRQIEEGTAALKAELIRLWLEKHRPRTIDRKCKIAPI